MVDKTIPSLFMTWIEELAGTSYVTVAKYINSSWNYVAFINKNNQTLSSPHGVYHSFDSSPYVTWSELDNVSVSQIRVGDYANLAFLTYYIHLVMVFY